MFKDGARYNGIGPWMKEYFGGRTVKLAIDGGFTCPNRDGTLSSDGCIFCSSSGSGDFTSDRRLSITEQMRAQVEIMSEKWRSARFIAYFQNYTNTYAPAAALKRRYSEALSFPGCCGLAIATRPDCLSNEVVALLSDLNKKTFLWVELGLQTSNDSTAEIINRCCTTSVYDDAVKRLTSAGIRVVTHVIFGLPGETRSDMLETVRCVCRYHIFGIKIHLLHIMKGTLLGQEYLSRQGTALNSLYADLNNASDISDAAPGAAHAVAQRSLYSLPALPEITPMEKDDYINVVADALEIIPPDITIHRLTGDAPRDLLIAPLWSRDKKSVLNGINMELKKRGTMQGSRVTSWL